MICETDNMYKWARNYYTLESLNIIKCILCGAKYKPEIKSKILKKHISENSDERHCHAYQKQWDSYLKIENEQQDLVIKCKYCNRKINNAVLEIPKKAKNHLEEFHEIIIYKWYELNQWIEKTNEVIATSTVNKLLKCKRCDFQIKNSITLLKHLLIKHNVDIPKHLMPKRLSLSSSNRNEDGTLSREQPSSDPEVIPGASPVQPSAAKDIALSSDRPSSDRRNIPGPSTQECLVYPSASPVKPSAAKDIALSSDRPSSDPRNIPGTSAQECPSSSKRKRDSSTETFRKRFVLALLVLTFVFCYDIIAGLCFILFSRF